MLTFLFYLYLFGGFAVSLLLILYGVLEDEKYYYTWIGVLFMLINFYSLVMYAASTNDPLGK